jgi:hypothetical protein
MNWPEASFSNCFPSLGKISENGSLKSETIAPRICGPSDREFRFQRNQAEFALFSKGCSLIFSLVDTERWLFGIASAVCRADTEAAKDSTDLRKAFLILARLVSSIRGVLVEALSILLSQHNRKRMRGRIQPCPVGVVSSSDPFIASSNREYWSMKACNKSSKGPLRNPTVLPIQGHRR